MTDGDPSRFIFRPSRDPPDSSPGTLRNFRVGDPFESAGRGPSEFIGRGPWRIFGRGTLANFRPRDLRISPAKRRVRIAGFPQATIALGCVSREGWRPVARRRVRQAPGETPYGLGVRDPDGGVRRPGLVSAGHVERLPRAVAATNTPALNGSLRRQARPVEPLLTQSSFEGFVTQRFFP